MQIGIGISLTNLRSGAAVVYSAEATTAFAAMSTQPSAALKGLINTCIVSLKTAGVWAKLDALYLMNAETAQAARVNIKNPGTYDLTATSSPTFTAKSGYAGDGAAAYLNTAFNPFTATTPQFVQNSACLFGWSLKTTLDTGALVGVAGAGGAYLYSRYTGNVSLGRVNTTAGDISVASADGSGLFAINRTAAGASQLYRNGSSIGTGAAASAAPASVVTTLLRANTEYFGGTMMSAGIGASLSAQEHSDLYAALNTFKAGVDALP